VRVKAAGRQPSPSSATGSYNGGTLRAQRRSGTLNARSAVARSSFGWAGTFHPQGALVSTPRSIRRLVIIVFSKVVIATLPPNSRSLIPEHGRRSPSGRSSSSRRSSALTARHTQQNRFRPYRSAQAFMRDNSKLSQASLLQNVSYFRYRQESPQVKFKLLTATNSECGAIREAVSSRRPARRPPVVVFLASGARWPSLMGPLTTSERSRWAIDPKEECDPGGPSPGPPVTAPW
jgi:hypothetical protein